METSGETTPTLTAKKHASRFGHRLTSQDGDQGRALPSGNRPPEEPMPWSADSRRIPDEGKFKRGNPK
jgi:hypothetical protein